MFNIAQTKKEKFEGLKNYIHGRKYDHNKDDSCLMGYGLEYAGVATSNLYNDIYRFENIYGVRGGDAIYWGRWDKITPEFKEMRIKEITKKDAEKLCDILGGQ